MDDGIQAVEGGTLSSQVSPILVGHAARRATARRGPWIETFGGRQFFPLDPRPEEVHLEDIGHALANLCRYTGHTSRFYSVAEHSVLCSLAAPYEQGASLRLKREALMHDATEAYIGDLSRPVKRAVPQFEEIEARLRLAIAERFGLAETVPTEVSEVDNRILVNERETLMRGLLLSEVVTREAWASIEGLVALPGIEIAGLLPVQAKNLFFSRCAQLEVK
jgi:hypothetical protein